MFGDVLHVRQENVGSNYYKYAVFYIIIFPGFPSWQSSTISKKSSAVFITEILLQGNSTCNYPILLLKS